MKKSDDASSTSSARLNDDAPRSAQGVAPISEKVGYISASLKSNFFMAGPAATTDAAALSSTGPIAASQ
jgi:hypothetical protein